METYFKEVAWNNLYFNEHKNAEIFLILISKARRIFA